MKFTIIHYQQNLSAILLINFFGKGHTLLKTFDKFRGLYVEVFVHKYLKGAGGFMKPCKSQPTKLHVD